MLSGKYWLDGVSYSSIAKMEIQTKRNNKKYNKNALATPFPLSVNNSNSDHSHRTEQGR